MCLPWWLSDVCTVGSHFTCQVYSTGWVAPVPLIGRGIFGVSSWLVYGRQPIRVFAARSEPPASPHASCSNHILIQQHRSDPLLLYYDFLIFNPLGFLVVKSLTMFYISTELRDWQCHQLRVHRADQRAWSRSGGGASFRWTSTRADQWLQPACTQGTQTFALFHRSGQYSWTYSSNFLCFDHIYIVKLVILIFICKLILIFICKCILIFMYFLWILWKFFFFLGETKCWVFIYLFTYKQYNKKNKKLFNCIYIFIKDLKAQWWFKFKYFRVFYTYLDKTAVVSKYILIQLQ